MKKEDMSLSTQTGAYIYTYYSYVTNMKCEQESADLTVGINQQLDWMLCQNFGRLTMKLFGPAFWTLRIWAPIEVDGHFIMSPFWFHLEFLDAQGHASAQLSGLAW